MCDSPNFGLINEPFSFSSLLLLSVEKRVFENDKCWELFTFDTCKSLSCMVWDLLRECIPSQTSQLSAVSFSGVTNWDFDWGGWANKLTVGLKLSSMTVEYFRAFLLNILKFTLMELISLQIVLCWCWQSWSNFLLLWVLKVIFCHSWGNEVFQCLFWECSFFQAKMGLFRLDMSSLWLQYHQIFQDLSHFQGKMLISWFRNSRELVTQTFCFGLSLSLLFFIKQMQLQNLLWSYFCQ